MTKRKAGAWLAAGALTLMLLAGCTGNTQQTGGGPSAPQAASGGENAGEAVTVPEGRVEVAFWYSGGKRAVAVVQEIIDDFNASQDTYYVTASTQGSYDETYSKLQAAISDKVAPDVVLLDADVSRTLSDRGLVTDLTSLLMDDESFSPDDYLQVYYRQGVDDNGKIFALPAYGTTQVLYYNIAAFEAVGIRAEDIRTWQDLADAAKKIKATGAYEYGWEPMWGRDNLIDAAFSNGASIFSEDGKTVTINSPEWVEVWESFRKWIHDDQIMTIHSGGQGWEYWYRTIDDVMQGTAGGYTGSSGDRADLDFSIVAAMEQPAWDADSESAPMAEALLLNILESSPEDEKRGAYEFVRYFTSVEAQAKWTMETGYVAVNMSLSEDAGYQAYIEKNPQAGVPFSQSMHCTVYPHDPTNGAVIGALSIACDRVEIDNVPAQEALDEAQRVAQEALDEVLGK